RGELDLSSPVRLNCDLRAARANRPDGPAADEASSGGTPTTASGWDWPRRQSDTDTNWARPRGPTDGAMKASNLFTSPSVASASAAADAKGVCTFGSTPANSAPASFTRSFSRRFSLLV